MPVSLPAVGSLNWGDALNTAITGLSTTIDAHSAVLASQPNAVADSTDILALSNTTFAAGANCGFSFVAPGTGKVWAKVSAHMETNTADSCYLGFEIRAGGTVGSGTVFLAAAVDSAAGVGGVVGARTGNTREKLVTGLTPGTTYNIRTMHLCTGGNYDIFAREIAIDPVKYA
jgi:hypothetical protein